MSHDHPTDTEFDPPTHQAPEVIGQVGYALEEVVESDTFKKATVRWGLQSKIGYAVGIAEAAAGVALSAAEAADAVPGLPQWVGPTLFAVGTALIGLTGKIRGDQAKELAKEHGVREV